MTRDFARESAVFKYAMVRSNEGKLLIDFLSLNFTRGHFKWKHRFAVFVNFFLS